MSERDDFQVQRGARLDDKSERVEQRDDDGRHDCRLSENAHNLNRRNTNRVLGRHSSATSSATACRSIAVRFAAELCYDVTVVKDATADYSDDAMHAALDVNMTNYAAIMTTNEVVESMASLVDVRTQSPGGGS